MHSQESEDSDGGMERPLPELLRVVREQTKENALQAAIIMWYRAMDHSETASYPTHIARRTYRKAQTPQLNASSPTPSAVPSALSGTCLQLSSCFQRSIMNHPGSQAHKFAFSARSNKALYSERHGRQRLGVTLLNPWCKNWDIAEHRALRSVYSKSLLSVW